MSTSSPTQRNEIQSLASALSLLETLAGLEAASLSELVRESRLTYNQTFRMLATLEARGYVLRDRQKVYRLGPQVALLGQRAGWPHELVEAAAPHLDALCELSGELVLLAVRSGLERMVVDRRPSRYSLRVDWPVGSRLPLHVGGLGVALLAFAPPEVQAQVLKGPLERYTPHTLSSPQALRKELQRVRQNRVRVSVDDWALGEFSVAAPIVHDDLAFGAVNIAGFTARLDARRRNEYSCAVKSAAEAIAAIYSRESAFPNT